MDFFKISEGRSLYQGWGKFLRKLAITVSVALAITGLADGRAAADTGIRALDTPALKIKMPVSAMLIAITKAGSRLVAVGEHGLIVYSDDNGSFWQQAAVPVDVTFTSLAFATPKIGWAVGHYGVIMQTLDGGATWKVQLNGLQANQLAMAAAQAVKPSDTAPGAPLALRRATAYMQEGPDKPFLSVLAQDADHVIVFGAYRMAERTTDGGKTWVDWTLHIGDPHSHNLYNTVTVANDIFIVAESGLVFHSTDAGETFPLLNFPIAATLLTATPTGDGGLFVGGVAGTAYVTRDHGQTWQPSSIATSVNITTTLALKSGAMLLACEDGSLYLSADGARTFQPTGHLQQMALFDMVQAANGDVVAVGNLGVDVIPLGEIKVNKSGD